MVAIVGGVVGVVDVVDTGAGVEIDGVVDGDEVVDVVVDGAAVVGLVVGLLACDDVHATAVTVSAATTRRTRANRPTAGDGRRARVPFGGYSPG